MKKLLMFLMFFSVCVSAQGKNHEVNSEVKELMDFHDVIYQIWHTGWPEKNIEFLSSLLPEVESGFEKIQKAELPGILREKKSKWEEGLSKFGKCVEDYKTAVAKKDSVGLLTAAEKLHSQFEMQVRIIRPIMKEIEAFHQVLYMVYHYYVKDYNLEKIKESAAQMLAKVDELNKAKLSERMKPREENFNKAKSELELAVKKLNDVVKSGNNKSDVKAAVNFVHSKYEELEKVFN
jgi:hypothetical protein